MEATKMMGFENPGDQPVNVPYRHWDSTKRALWRSKLAWEIAQNQASFILQRCKHLPDCPGEDDKTKACEPDCPDREFRASALVILGAAEQFLEIAGDRKPANGPYYAPSREHHSAVIAELVALQAENEWLLAALREKGVSTDPETMITLGMPKALPQKEIT